MFGGVSECFHVHACMDFFAYVRVHSQHVRGVQLVHPYCYQTKPTNNKCSVDLQSDSVHGLSQNTQCLCPLHVSQTEALEDHVLSTAWYFKQNRRKQIRHGSQKQSNKGLTELSAYSISYYIPFTSLHHLGPSV